MILPSRRPPSLSGKRSPAAPSSKDRRGFLLCGGRGGVCVGWGGVGKSVPRGENPSDFALSLRRQLQHNPQSSCHCHRSAAAEPTAFWSRTPAEINKKIPVAVGSDGTSCVPCRRATVWQLIHFSVVAHAAHTLELSDTKLCAVHTMSMVLLFFITTNQPVRTKTFWPLKTKNKIKKRLKDHN